MKKVINFVLLSTLVVLLSYSQQQTGDTRTLESSIDLIVLIDTSSGMSGYYQEFLKFISGPFLREFLRIGDTFHILSFSENTKTELARRIEGVGDVETIIGRLYLLYPLENRRDLSKALDYAWKYIAALPPDRPKKLVIFTAAQETAQFTRAGTDFYQIRFPLTGAPISSGRPPRPAPAQPPAQQTTQAPSAAPAQSPAAPARPQQPAPVQTPPPSPPQTQTAQKNDTAPEKTAAQPPVTEDMPKKSILQSLLAFFAGIGKRDTEESGKTEKPAQIPAKTEPANDKPVQASAQQTTQAPSAAPAQSPAAPTQPQQPAAPVQTPPPSPPQTQTAQKNETAPEKTAAPPRTVTEDKPKKNILQSLLAFFAGAKKQDVEKSGKPEKPEQTPAKTGPVKDKPAAAKPAEPVQTPPAPPKSVTAQPGPASAEQGEKFPLWILLFIILSLGVTAVTVTLVYLIRRKFQAIPVRAVFYVGGRTAASPFRRARAKPDTKPMLCLEVDNQNRNIGRRNTHSLKAGSTYTVGGGKSDFLIFLVSLPPSIGILRFDGKECTFIPKKARYFPEIADEPVPDCIEKTIRVVSDFGYKLSFRFKQYEDPLIGLNQVMNSLGAALPDKS
jgi:hypothetical protein